MVTLLRRLPHYQSKCVCIYMCIWTIERRISVYIQYICTCTHARLYINAGWKHERMCAEETAPGTEFSYQCIRPSIHPHFLRNTFHIFSCEKTSCTRKLICIYVEAHTHLFIYACTLVHTAHIYTRIYTSIRIHTLMNMQRSLIHRKPRVGVCVWDLSRSSTSPLSQATLFLYFIYDTFTVFSLHCLLLVLMLKRYSFYSSVHFSIPLFTCSFSLTNILFTSLRFLQLLLLLHIIMIFLWIHFLVIPVAAVPFTVLQMRDPTKIPSKRLFSPARACLCVRVIVYSHTFITHHHRNVSHRIVQFGFCFEASANVSCAFNLWQILLHKLGMNIFGLGKARSNGVSVSGHFGGGGGGGGDDIGISL